MSDAPPYRATRGCANCPLWPAGTQSGFPTMEKIQLCIHHVLGGRRQWITGEEFLAEVQAHREARRKTPPKTYKHFEPGTPVRIYVLDYSRRFTPKPPELIIPEDAP